MTVKAAVALIRLFTKWPKPEEIAQVILFLASDDAELIHGETISV